MEFTVYLSMLPEVQKRLDKVAKKAKRYGVPFSYEVGAQHKQTVAVYSTDWHTQSVDHTYDVAAVDVIVNCDSFICADGWTVKAKLEHTDNGNIVTAFDGEITPAWYECKPRCEHCNSNRFRAVTYMVEKDGATKQVGSGCLKDYTGINPALAAMWAEVRNIYNDCSGYDPESFRSMYKDIRVYDVDAVLAAAYDSIKARGYIKSEERNSTKSDILDRLDKRVAPSADGKAAAVSIMEYLRARKNRADADRTALNAISDYEPDDPDCEYWRVYHDQHKEWDCPSDFEINAATVASCGFVRANQVGLLAYIPVAYEKFNDKVKRHAEREAEAAKSDFVGNVGERLTVKTQKAALLTSWETQYGYTYLYRFTDTDGNVFVWFASTVIDAHDGMTIKGTVKDHNERNGEKQTVLTRCKVA